MAESPPYPKNDNVAGGDGPIWVQNKALVYREVLAIVHPDEMPLDERQVLFLTSVQVPIASVIASLEILDMASLGESGDYQLTTVYPVPLELCPVVVRSTYPRLDGSDGGFSG